MTIDYKEIREILQIRKTQIADDAFEFKVANLEDRKIDEIIKSIGEILVGFKMAQLDSPAVGEVYLESEVLND